MTLVILVIVAASCSSGSPGETGDGTAPPVADGGDGSDSTTSDDADDPDSADVVDSDATPGSTTVATLSSEGHASVTDLAAGEPVEDVQGNLIAIYGVVEWPQPFDALPGETVAQFPFFGDVAEAGDPDIELMALDIGMCSAGVGETRSGTVEFFVHDSPDDVLSVDPVLDRGVLARHPVVQPGFSFPATAECTRGFLPVLWSGSGVPTTARYVLASRESTATDVERHVYQWDLDEVEALDVAADPFLAGQTVTFNDGPLSGTTVVVDGWAERVGVASELEGTRVVSVSLALCPASPTLPEFGLSVDGWNIAAPLPNDVVGAAASSGPELSCFEGWLDFAVPFGGVPTGFFASDGIGSNVGYAEWTLENAALPVPQ